MGAGITSQANYDGPRDLAAKLASEQPCIVAFMSPACGLCSSLLPALDKVASSSSGLQVAVLNGQQDTRWAPEMLVYNVETVPCFVLLEPGGKALCKTPPPSSRQQMEAALQEMAQHAGRGSGSGSWRGKAGKQAG